MATSWRSIPKSIDARRFERIVRSVADRATTEPLRAAAELREALALWRGDALVEFADASWAQAEISKLAGLQLWAIEARIDADLTLGRHAALIPELESLVGAYPLRERFWGQLMLALYRSGRQAEALRAYRRLHSALDEELGIRPSTELVQMEQAMLLHEPSLDLSRPCRPLVPARRRRGARPRASMLPLTLESVLDTPFVGRESEIDRYLPGDVERAARGA